MNPQLYPRARNVRGNLSSFCTVGNDTHKITCKVKRLAHFLHKVMDLQDPKQNFQKCCIPNVLTVKETPNPSSLIIKNLLVQCSSEINTTKTDQKSLFFFALNTLILKVLKLSCVSDNFKRSTEISVSNTSVTRS